MTGNASTRPTGERPPTLGGERSPTGAHRGSETEAVDGISDKALMLIECGDVTLHFVTAHRVKATVGSFDVTMYRDQWRCSCPARRECCRVAAVALVTKEPPEPTPTFATYDDATPARSSA